MAKPVIVPDCQTVANYEGERTILRKERTIHSCQMILLRNVMRRQNSRGCMYPNLLGKLLSFTGRMASFRSRKGQGESVLPLSYRVSVLCFVHDPPIASHLRTSKTLAHVEAEFHWPGIMGTSLITVSHVKTVSEWTGNWKIPFH